MWTANSAKKLEHKLTRNWHKSIVDILLQLAGPEFDQFKHPLLLEDSAQTRDQL